MEVIFSRKGVLQVFDSKIKNINLLFALEHSELSFYREFSRMNDIMKPCDLG